MEGLVNGWIQEGHSLRTEVMPLDEAKASGEWRGQGGEGWLGGEGG